MESKLFIKLSIRIVSRKRKAKLSNVQLLVLDRVTFSNKLLQCIVNAQADVVI